MTDILQCITREEVRNINKKSELAYPQSNAPKIIPLSGESYEDSSNKPKERQILDETVALLEKESLAELNAIMLLGRGAGGEVKSDFPDLVKTGIREYESDQLKPRYISAKRMLARYLSDGLAKLEDN